MIQEPTARMIQDDWEKDIWMRGSCKHGKSQQESALKEINQNTGQETSTGVDVQVPKNLINENIQLSDNDIRRQPKMKDHVEKRIKDLINSFFAKVVNKFLTLLGQTRSSRPLLVCLMLPIQGFKDLKENGSETGCDSGIHSNLGPVLLSQDSGDLQMDSPPGFLPDAIDRQEVLIRNAPGAPALAQAGGFGRVEEERSNDGVDEMVVGQPVPNQRRVAGQQEGFGPVRNQRNVFHPHPLQYFSAVSSFDVRIGDKQELMMFIGNIERTPVGAGIFLNEHAPMYGFHGPKRSFAIGDGYTLVSQFQPGKMVYLMQCVNTRQFFVSKWVPMVHRGRQNEQNELQHKQQVELVVGQQDWCSGLAKIHGVIKRLDHGREFVEVFMEYCQGGTFHDNMTSLMSLTMMAKWRLAQKVLDIVQYLHHQTIIHGDLKYANMAFRNSHLDVALIDFESAKHPHYRTNMRATYLFLPPWYEKFFNSRDFSLLKTLDMWSLGIVLLKIVFGQQLWGQEHSQLQHCNSCNMRDGTCLHIQARFLCLMRRIYPHAIRSYLPNILPNDDPVQKRLACLLYGLLPQCGPSAQLTASEAKEALEECMVLVLILKEGRPTIPPVVVKQGTTIKTFVQSPRIRQLKSLHPDLEDGLWFTAESQSVEGSVKECSVTKNHRLTESCRLHVYPPIGPPCSSAVV